MSKKTVSRVINHSPLVREETREKVTALMPEVGYAPDPQARGLAFRRSFLIGLVYDNPNAQYIVNMQYGALDALRGSGFELVVHPCDSKSADFIDGVRKFVQQQKLHGVILVPPVSEDQALADMLKDIGCRYVRIASVPAGRHAAQHGRHQRPRAPPPKRPTTCESLGPSRHRPDHRPQATIARRANAARVSSKRLARAAWSCRRSAIVEGGYTFESGVAGAEQLLARKKPRRPRSSPATTRWRPVSTRPRMRLGLSIPEQICRSSASTTARWPRACGRR